MDAAVTSVEREALPRVSLSAPVSGCLPVCPYAVCVYHRLPVYRFDTCVPSSVPVLRCQLLRTLRCPSPRTRFGVRTDAGPLAA